MSIHSGIISVEEIEKIYNVGYSYAENIVDKLEEIGYIKKRSDDEYSMIQTEKTINAYIKKHFAEFRPDYYDILELKNNGKPTLKANLKKAKKNSPMFMCRIFVSPLSVILILLSITTRSFIPFVIGIICNIGYGIYASQNRDIKFTDFMLRPWFNVRVRTVLEICEIMKKSNIKFNMSSYYETLRRLKIHLRTKKKLAEHYADMANNAENENEFYQSINSCLEVLEWMSQFEKYKVYDILQEPSADIKRIKEGMPISIERFNNRMKASGNIDLEYDYMEGHDFEYFCADILKKNGFTNVEVTQGSGDQGIDIIAFKDDVKYGIQCKCYSSDIGNKAVQEAFSGKAFYGCHVAVVLTNRFFTASAKELSKKNGVLLWDRNRLEEMIKNET